MALQRRKFLTASAIAAGLAYGLPLRNHALSADDASKSTKMKLGLVTYNWGKDWDLPTVIKNCEQTKFGGVELRSTHKHGVEISLSPQERKEVAQRFADSSVELVGLGSACEYHSPDPATVRKNIEETKAFIKLCHDVGGEGVKVRPNGLPKQVPVEKTLTQIGESLREVAEFGAEHGVVIRVEVHGRDGSAELPMIHQMMEIADHPNAVVCWNCNASDMNGKGLQSNFELVQDKIGILHIHDLRTTTYPWKELFSLLKKSDFSGWTLIEEGSIPKDIIGSMHENKVLWDQLS